MSSMPKKVKERLISGIKKFQPILESAKSKDINESDTVTIITDMLSELFGFDKYSEITSEYLIKRTYCDLALILNGKLECLIEAKAIGLDSNERYIKQAVDYAANQGVDWVILSTGICWKVYKVTFSKPIDFELVLDFDFLSLNNKKKEDLELIFKLTKEGWLKNSLESYHAQKQALSRYIVGALLLSDKIVNDIRRELRKLSPDIKIQSEQIKDVLTQEVIKREVVEGDKFKESKRIVSKIMTKIQKHKPPKINEPIKNTEQKDLL